MAIYIILVPVSAYLLGSIPFGFILARVFLGTDVRKIGSGNIGATNVLRTGSKRLGIATLVLDAAKGYVAVLLAGILAGLGGRADTHLLMSVAALFAVLGHVFPIWLRFKGGKGVATGVGVFLALVPKAVLIVLAIFVLIFAASRYVSLASIIATAAFPVITYLLLGRQADLLMPFIVATVALILLKHQQNIRRLIAGNENRFGTKKSGGAA
jgi:glycerol-3-phosphate acyltransferase PlsY